MFCGSVGKGRSSKGRDTEEIDKTIFYFGETLIKLAKTVKETLRNEILFCRKLVWQVYPWQKIMTNTYFFDLVAADAILSIHWLPCFSRMIIIYIILRLSRGCIKLIRVVDAFYIIFVFYIIHDNILHYKYKKRTCPSAN